jgi:integrase/recombinase XerC
MPLDSAAGDGAREGGISHDAAPATPPASVAVNPSTATLPLFVDGPTSCSPEARAAELPGARGQAVNAPADAETARRLLDRFLAGRTATTLQAYADDLDDFAAFVNRATGGGRVDAVRRLLAGGNGEANGLALDYRAHLVDRKLAPATINRRLAALRSLVTLGRTLGIVTWPLDVENVRHKRYRDTRGPGELAVSRMLAELAPRHDAKGARDRAILHLLRDLALRRAEVAGLDVEHVDVGAGVVQLRGKGDTERTPVTLPQATRAALAEWLAVRGTTPGPLFTANCDRAAKARAAKASPDGGRLTGRSIHRLVKQLGAAAGVVARPHGIRHTSITVALDRTGGNVRAVQQFSRHADARTLLHYDDNRQDLAGQVAALVAAGPSGDDGNT